MTLRPTRGNLPRPTAIKPNPMLYRDQNIVVAGDPVDIGALEQIENCARLAQRVVMCADHHKGYGVPIGGVMADPERFAPACAGFDIACGMKAVRLDADPNDVRANIATIMDDIAAQISFGMGRANPEDVDHELFDDDAWRLPATRPHKQQARRQLGTVGGGNHWVNVFVDEENRVWIGCHFGSRGLGHKTATWFIEQMGASDAMDAPPKVLHERSPLGEAYIEAIRLAGLYAYAGRDWVCHKVAKIVGAKPLEEVHLHHNFLWREEHDGQAMWVGRKGSTPAFPGQRGLVGASMAEPCAIVEGVDSELSRELLYSTVHGAGRVMSRSKATGKVNRKTGQLLLDESGEPIRRPAVTRDMMDEWVSRSGVQLRGGNVDESPHVYKRLPEVLSHHEGTIRVVHWLQPIGVAMAHTGVFDPYKD